MADSDAIKRLQDAGVNIPVDQLSESQKQALGELTAEEVDTLARINQRMQGTDEVQGYARGDGNIIF